VAIFFTTYQGVYLLNMILILTLILILILILIPVPAGLFSYSYTHFRISFLLLLSAKRGISNRLDLSKRHEDYLVLY